MGEFAPHWFEGPVDKPHYCVDVTVEIATAQPGVTVAQSGNPVNVTYSPDTPGLAGSTTNRPNFDLNSRKYPKKQLAWFNPAAHSALIAPWDGDQF